MTGAPPTRAGSDEERLMRLLFVACVVLLAGACASQAETGDRDCFSSSLVRGFDVVDEHHVRVSVGTDRSYIFSTQWNVRDLDWAHGIAIRSTSRRLCTGSAVGVDVVGGRPPRTYPISTIERATAPSE